MQTTTETNGKNFGIDVTGLPRYQTGQDAPIWWGIIGLILIELSVVAAFCVSVLYLQLINPDWPPPSITQPDKLYPTLSLAILLISCVTMKLAGVAINKNRVRAFVIYTFMSVGMALVVLAIRAIAMSDFEFNSSGHVYGSLMWTISGFHFLHVVSAAIGTAAIGFFGIAGYFCRERQIGVVVDTLYWNFVAIAWIPFYLVLYWAPEIS